MTEENGNTQARFRTARTSHEQFLSSLGREQLIERLKALQGISETVLTHVELDDLLEALLERICGELKVDAAAVLLAEDGGARVRLRAARGLESGGEGVVPVGRGLAGMVAERKLPVIVDDVAAFPVARPALRQLRSMLASPLLARGELIGVVHAGTRAPRNFTDAELHLLREIADRMALAIKNARLYEDAQREIAERREAERALGESEHRFRLMVREVTDYAIFMLDPDGRVASWNEGAVRIKGYSEEEVLGRHFSIFYPPEDVERNRPAEQLRRAREAGRHEEIGKRIRKDGSTFWANVVITAIVDHGELVGYAKITRDVTERVEQQRALEATAAELERKVDELRHRTEEAEAANRVRSDFLAVMSHELRTPLTAIVGYSELLLMGVTAELPPKALDQIRRIEHAARHQLRLVEEILTFSRLNAGAETVLVRRFDLAELVEEMVALFGAEAEKAGVPLSMTRPDGPVLVESDPDKVRQILSHLLDNARKFTRSGEIRVEVDPSGGGRVRVSDTGVGVAAENVEKIFEPFWQVQQTSTREAEGSGLGLAVSRGLATLLGAELTLESRRGEGTTFTLQLPPSDAE